MPSKSSVPNHSNKSPCLFNDTCFCTTKKYIGNSFYCDKTIGLSGPGFSAHKRLLSKDSCKVFNWGAKAESRVVHADHVLAAELWSKT